MGNGPLSSLLATIKNALKGLISFPRDRVGRTFVSEDGKEYRVMRQVIVRRDGKPEARFIVRFRLAGLQARLNKWISIVPIPFFIGMEGFRSKLWMMDDLGECQGYYEWLTVGDAERYSRSFAMKFMKRRAVPGSISHEIKRIE